MSLVGEKVRVCQSPEVKRKDNTKDVKHENTRGKTVFKNKTSQIFSTPNGNPSSTPQTCHHLSNCTQPNKRIFPCHHCLAKFRFKSCLKQHLRIHSGDTAFWQKDFCTDKVISTQLKFWRDKLIDYETLNIITDYPRPSQMNHAGQDIYFELDVRTSMNLRRIATELKVSLYTVLLSGYYLLLRIYNKQDDIVVGTLIANRHYSQIKKISGFFVNTLPIRIQMDSTYLLTDFIKQIGSDIITNRLNQDLPFEKVVEKLAAAKDSSRHPICQVMFGLKNFETSLQSRIDEESDKAYLLEPCKARSPHNVAKFDLTTVMDDSGSILTGVFNYATTLYREKTINGYIETYVHILDQLSTLVADKTNQKRKTIADLSYLSVEQYHQIIHKWNATDIEYPADKTVHQLFEEQVAKTPGNIATVYKDVRLTYKELNESANRLATYLIKEFNIKPDSLIPLCLERSEHMLIAILAVLKSGGAYVPIDPTYPDERIQYILQDTSTSLLLTNDIHKRRLEGVSCASNTSKQCLEARQPLNIIAIDGQAFKDTLALQAIDNPNTMTKSGHLAYVIYTSGTTGEPKGVMVEHRRWLNINKVLVDRYKIGGANVREVILQFSNYVFDISVEQIILGLTNGHVLLLIPNQLWLNNEKFNHYLSKNKVTHIQAPPRFLEQHTFSKIMSLKRIVSVGEMFSMHTYDKTRLNNSINITNAYGSTETSLISTMNIMKKGDIRKGSPISNIRTYVLADNLVPVPVGAIGELHIGGSRIARGYLNRPYLTAERFITNPFQTKKEKTLGRNARLYKTGDLVRLLQDGKLEYIGRNDLQVKIRGYRIELGEIESALSAYEGVKQSVALAKKHNNAANQASSRTYLVGYYVSDGKLDEQGMFSYLASKLPDYMVPTILIHIKKLPLTINGKLNRKALPDPEFSSKDNYVAPRNKIEEKACQIWAEVLGLSVDKIGTHDDFFRLGGDSIISLQLVSRLRKELQINVTVKNIFSSKSIARLYESVLEKDLGKEKVSSLQNVHGILVGAVPLLPIQEWFFKRNVSAAHHWNQSFLIKTPKLDIGRLRESLDKLIQHHDCFRLRYKKNTTSSSFEQYYDGYAKLEPVKVLDISTLGYQENSQAFKTTLKELSPTWQADFDLTDGPMYSVSYLYGYGDGSTRIHFALHRLIVDVVSWRIVTKDLRDLYYGSIPSSKGSSYRQWATIVRDYSSNHRKERSYWNNILSDNDSSWLKNSLLSESTAHFTRICLSQEYTSLLLQQSNQAYHTKTIDLLLTALAYTLTEITGSNINHVLLEDNGREHIDSNLDITKTLGWFATMYPIRLEVLDAFGTSIRSIKESLRMIPHKGMGFGSIMEYKCNDLPSISFNYSDQFAQENSAKLKYKNIWQIVENDVGKLISRKNWDTNAININGLVMNGMLIFGIGSKLDGKTTKALTCVFKQQLELIINHTINQPRSFLTVSDTDHIISKKKLDALQESRETEAIYLANNLQQGFIYHNLIQGEVDDAYITQQIWQYHCSLNIYNLKQAWRYARDKFSSLRVRFDWQEDLVQIIDKDYAVDWRYINLSSELNIGTQESTVKHIQEKDRLERYDLAHGNLFRIHLIKQKWDLYTCIFSNHHAIIDGWSVSILLEYIHDTYLKLNRKEVIFLQPDYAYQAAQQYIRKHQNDDKAYWDQYITQVEERSDLGGLLISSSKKLNEYKHILHPTEKTLSITGNIYNSLKLLSQQEGVTLNALLQYAWHKVLNVYGNNKQTIVGTTVSGRSLPVDDIEKSVGLYINTLPLIVDHQGSKRIIESIMDIQSGISEFHNRSNVNLAKLQSSAERLFDSLFVYENYPNLTSVAQDEVELTFISLIEKLDYPLNVRVCEANNELIFQLQYAGELFSDDTISNLLCLTRILLEQLPSRAQQVVTGLSYLNAQQFDQIIYRWNATDKEYPANKTIHQLFEKQAANMPDNVAIIYKEVQLTYRELNERANRLAMYLIKEFNIEPDHLIALCLDRSEHMLIAILAVLKSGGAYVPIDPGYPNERIQYILKDTGTSILVTNEIHHERLENVNCSGNAKKEYLDATQRLNILSIDSQAFKDTLSLQDVSNPNTNTTSGNLAYVIYTSGTTGKPKGVMVEHRGLVNLNSDLVKRYALGNAKDREVILQFSNYVFDASIEQIILGLLNGHALLLVPNQLWLNKDCFINYLVANEVTHIQATPRFLEQHNFREVLSLKRLVSVGEALDNQIYKKICLNAGIDIVNAYGPTEISVCSVVNIIQNGDLNMGSPISNTRCYVLAENLVPLPVGAVGELYIGGAGVARGYLNRPDLTEERFIANPFQTEEENKKGTHKKLYKTGDLVRWLKDGNLEYIGRTDLQIKIRGYRIELGEIEIALSGYEGIKHSVALAKEHNNVASEESGSKYLVGYYVSDEKLDEDAILSYLASKLPDYMVPTILVHLKKLPLTINGKLDRKALPDPQFFSQNNYVAPRNKIEEKACQIWAEVLGLSVDKIGTNDDFFRLGGDSIISIQLVSRLRKQMQMNVSVNDIFSYKNIARLYDNVLEKGLSKDEVSSLQNEYGILVGAVTLLPIQEWFFWRNFSAAHHWNQSFLIKTPKLDIGRLRDSLNKLIQHHDCFRLRYKKNTTSSSFEQYYDGYAKLEPVKVLDISTLGYQENSQAFKTTLKELSPTWQADFDLTDGPMYSVSYLYGYGDGSARINFALHRLIVDVVSWRIVTEDLRDLYYGSILSSKGSSYRQWAKIVRDYSIKHQEEESFWNNTLSDYDSSRLKNSIVSESTAHFTRICLSQEYTSLLLQQSNQAYHTKTIDLLLTALAYTLKEITGSNINHVLLEGNGREHIDSNLDMTKALGWFTTIFPVRLEVVDALETSIRSIKESLRRIPHKGLGFGPILGYKSNALPIVSFNYLGQFNQENSATAKANNVWQIVENDGEISLSPKNKDTNVINFDGLVLNGRLEFRILNKLDGKTTKALASVFKQQLELIINHTINQQRSFLTVSDTDHMVSKNRLEALQESREIEAIYLANNLQQGFIYHHLSRGNVDDAYLVQEIWQYQFSLNNYNLKQAWRYARDKFSSLRVRFDWQEDLLQIIDKDDGIDWRYIDLSSELNIGKQESTVKHIQEKDRLERYDLAHGNLFRIHLIKQKWDLYTCIFSNHHAIIDGWSMPILLGYINETYLRLDRKEKIFVQPDYAYGAAQQYIRKHQNDDKAYWVKYINQVVERVDLSGILRSSSGKRLSEYKLILNPSDKTLTITGNLYSSLKLLSQQEGVTFSAILQYAWHKVLSVFGNNKQTIVGTTVSGRSLPVDDIEKSVGLYINTLPLIVVHEASKLLIESIKEIQSTINEFNGKSNVNLAKLQPSAERLFDSLFIYENLPNPTSDKFDFTCKGRIGKLDYPLNVNAFEANNELIFQLQYAGELFSDNTISNFLCLTKTLLEQLPSRAYQAVSNLRYLNAQQYDQIIYRWNATDTEYPADQTIHKMFEMQVEKTPENVAIVYKEVQLTYKELNERANRLAMCLIKEFSIEPDSLIALCLDKSEYMLIAILAVLKSGGAYVPINPGYPNERIQYILKDTGTNVLLTNKIHHERLENILFLDNANQEYLEARQTLNILSIDSEALSGKLSTQTVTNPNTNTTSGNLAYVIYTSGTTGKPKGVMIEHKGLVNLNSALVDKYTLGNASDTEVILQFSNYVFDASVEQIILGLLNGHVVLLIPDQLWLNKKEFHMYLLANNVTHIDSTPRFLEEQDLCEILSLRRIVVGGEVVSKQSYAKIRIKDKISIINAYGTTETSITSTVKILEKGDLSLGSPIYNTRCYVLADNMVPVPVGAIGELYIGGAGLARGYLNRPDLTDDTFIPNPFLNAEEKQLEKNAKLYKTGDLVRLLQGGNLEYIGRKDLQAKIRGYRIELGEIESALSAYEGIIQSVVLANEHSNVASQASGSKYLVGYYVSDEKLDEDAILSYLASKLPDYMVPTILVHLTKLPLTINGKLDQKALPDPKFTGQNDYVAPRNEIEEKACQIWAEVLGLSVDKIGTNDDFFRLGGDSIISIQLVSRLRKQMQMNVSVKDIFSYKNIARLYDNVLEKGLSKDEATSLRNEHGILVGAVAPLPIQEWFCWCNFSAAHHWNQSFLIKVPRLDLGRLRDSLNKLIQHHDCFRLRYKMNKNSSSFEQYYDGYAKLVPVTVLDISTLGYKENSHGFKTRLKDLFTTCQANFDLTDGPLYSVGYFYGYQDGTARIHFALHHLIVDAVSWRIVSEDLRDLYYGSILSSKGSSYRQWAKTVRDYSSKHQEEESFWNNILSDYDSSRLKNLILSESTAHITSIDLSQEYTSLLLQKSNQAYHTQINDLLLTAFAYTLTKITGSNINHVLLEGHGREQIDSTLDITKTLGWFTTIYPVRLEVVDALGTSIRSIKESLRMIPHKGLGFGSILGYKSNALPRVSFNYLGQFTQESSAKPKNNNVWQIVENDSEISISPKNRGTNVIDFNGLVMDGRLEFGIVSKLDVEVTNEIGIVFKEQLSALISHCVKKSTIEYTISDFKDFEPVVVRNPEILESNNVIMFPPAFGGAECYFRNIVPRVRNKRLILFNNFYICFEKKLGKNYSRNLRFEQLAEDYVTYIKLYQPKGPYNLFGWSIGGVLAFEISKKLIGRGDCVANLILLDSCFIRKNVDLIKDVKSSAQDYINFRYPACLDTEMPNTNIILFKATKVEEIDFYKSMFIAHGFTLSTEEIIEMRKTDTFYAKKTEANNLDQLLKNHKIEVVPINHSHYSWVHSDDALKDICVKLEEL